MLKDYITGYFILFSLNLSSESSTEDRVYLKSASSKVEPQPQPYRVPRSPEFSR